ncbi:protein starmaker [Linepithema humile]|uniref:protein starmaker n=1 Tax=Linepithema humile TaxID=83485 RepID=UPI00062354AB|nr:PREDICTED: transcriptional regulator ATRX homolog [Linepithema humile]XP_012217997.1 PREDICTED: transcriptional regulator ATRX homolog [Linepithema humile]XP_012217998.1 PREDICTED: transcriptional regulator ATRX homolog [Linepithema humile]XP_012217999.1 PREDICTED: transcriptional regulator ATRX homolog [Linepithema humile]XP_012218000.1 PREDICTED: transcriptional regulator ATRX homolog [Linepithema humile]XP_012218001.1 PREDICTED: transcriptional regulator ATRX homolog [Linepithema humile]
MTTMDSDSASQDSDDGRRFRFEATRKDSAALVEDAMRRTRLPKKQSKHKSSRYESGRHYHRERKERSKHESDRKGDDLKHSAKHSKHESRNSRQEDGGSSKDHRDGRDAFIGFTVNDRDFRNSSGGGDEKEKSRDSKRQSDRDRSIHLAQRSRERSYERTHHEEQTSSDKHRSRYHERHGHRSRERSHQSSRVKSSNGDHRSRENHGRHDSSRKTSIKEDRSQNLKDYSSPKNVERERSHSEARSCENTKKDLSVNAQDCKDLDLSQFDVLSEIDENTSDDRDYESRASSPRETKLHSDSRDWLESCATKEARENGEDANKSKREWREELSKVKKRDYDPVSSSRSNPNAISDSPLSSAPPAAILIVRDTCTSSKREKFESTITCDTSECSGLGEKKCSDAFSDETRPEKDAEQTESVYGPLLPPTFVSNVSDSDEKTSPHALDENKIDNQVQVDESHKKSVCFIGPCPPPGLSSRQNEEREEAKDTNTSATEADTVFGPVLPPHLLQRQRDKIIGPVLPDAVQLCEESSVALSESDEDCAIGPLPVDHPALRNSRVHEKLDLRAQKIRNEGYLEEVDIGSKREEWMTELPPVQAANLGLGPRKFRVREGPDTSDRSSWTDTPAQKAQKQKDLEVKKLNNVSEPDKKCVEEFYKKDTGKSKKREKSLLEMHQSKIAKKKRKKEKEAERTGISTRRPFDRDIDLQVTRLDQAQKKTVLMKAQLLDDRFSRGQI